MRRPDLFQGLNQVDEAFLQEARQTTCLKGHRPLRAGFPPTGPLVLALVTLLLTLAAWYFLA